MKSKNTHINIRKKKKHMHSRKKTRRKVGSKAKITIRRKKTRRKVKSKKTRIRRNKNMRSIYKKRMNKKYRGGGWREWWVRKRSPLSRNTHSRSPSYLYRAAPTNYFSHDNTEESPVVGWRGWGAWFSERMRNRGMKKDSDNSIWDSELEYFTSNKDFIEKMQNIDEQRIGSDASAVCRSGLAWRGLTNIARGLGITPITSFWKAAKKDGEDKSDSLYSSAVRIIKDHIIKGGQDDTKLALNNIEEVFSGLSHRFYITSLGPSNTINELKKEIMFMKGEKTCGFDLVLPARPDSIDRGNELLTDGLKTLGELGITNETEIRLIPKISDDDNSLDLIDAPGEWESILKNRGNDLCSQGEKQLINLARAMKIRIEKVKSQIENPNVSHQGLIELIETEFKDPEKELEDIMKKSGTTYDVMNYKMGIY